MHGQPVLTFHSIDAARKTLRPVPWQTVGHGALVHVVPIPASEAFGAHYLLALPAAAGGGVLVFCEHSIFLVPRPAMPARGARSKPAAKRARPSVPALRHTRLDDGGQVVAACVLPTAPYPVLFAMADGTLTWLQGPWASSASSDAPFSLRRLAEHLPVPTGPHALTPLSDHIVMLASATGNSLLGLVHPTWRTLHAWPHAGPVLDLAMAAPAAGPAAPPRLLRACGVSPTYCLQLLSHALPTVQQADGAAPGCVDLFACHDHSSAHSTTVALVAVYAHEAHVYDASLQPRSVVPGRVVYAAGVHGHALLVTRTQVMWHTDPPHTFTPATEIVAAYASHRSVLVGLRHGRVALLHADVANGLTLVQEHVFDTDIACVWLGKEALIGFWDATVLRVALPTLTRQQAWAPAAPSVPSCVRLHAWTPDTPPQLVLGTVDGLVLVLDGETVVHTMQLRGPQVRCEPCALDVLGLRGTGLLLHTRADAGLLYAVGGQWQYSPWPARAVNALVRVHLPHTSALHCAVLADARLALHGVTGVQRDHVVTAALGTEAPTSLIVAAEHAVVTVWDEESARGSVVLYDPTTLERRSTMPLPVRERPNCVHVARRGKEVRIFLGTGYVTAAGAVPTSGRILIARLDGTLMELIGALDVPGHVLSVALVRQYIVAAVDAQVHTYAWDAETRRIRQVARWGCAFMASCLAAYESIIVVGDAMHSLTVLRVQEDGTLSELARDLDPYWTTAVGMYNAAAQEYVGADIAMNVFVAQRLAWKEGHTREAWSHVMRRTTAFHYGDMVHRIVRARDGCVYVAAAAGGVGMLTDLAPNDALVLSCLQEALNNEVRSVDGVPWSAWRTLRTDTREAPPCGVIDAEFVRTFLACDEAQRARILAAAQRLAEGEACRDALQETALRSLLSRLP